MNVKKELPNPKDRNLIPPDMDYVYFEGSDLPLFESLASDYSPANAWWLAECAFLSYCHPGFARMAFHLAGFSGFRFFGAKGTECMVSWNDQVTLVSFRGTELKSRSALHEIRTDINATPVPFEHGGMVHKGFLNGLDEVWGGPEGLEVFLKELMGENPDRPLWMTGHSLGGALATLCFARTSEATGLYLYGAPKIGDQEFADLFKGRCAWRIENVRDPIPLMPTNMPSIPFILSDVGALKFLSSTGDVLNERPLFVLEDHKTRYREAKAILDGKIKEMSRSIALKKEGRAASKQTFHEIGKHLRVTKKEWGIQMQEVLQKFGLNVDDHQPIFYATKTWNALPDTR